MKLTESKRALEQPSDRTYPKCDRFFVLTNPRVQRKRGNKNKQTGNPQETATAGVQTLLEANVMRYSKAEAGFTLTEKLIIIAVLNVLCAIAVPGWMGFMNSQQVTTANDRIYWCFQKAKSEARREKLTMECLIRQTPRGIEYSVNRVDEPPQWQSAGIDPKVTIKTATFYYDNKDAAYRMQYNWLGVSNGRLGRIHLVKGNAERCTVVSTLLGSQRTGRRGDSSNPCI